MKLAVFRKLAGRNVEYKLFAIVEAKNFYAGACDACQRHDMNRPLAIPTGQGKGWRRYSAVSWDISIRRADKNDVLPRMNEKAVLIVNASGMTRTHPIPNIYVPCVLTGHVKHIGASEHLEVSVGKLTYWVFADAIDTTPERVAAVFGTNKRRPPTLRSAQPHGE